MCCFNLTTLFPCCYQPGPTAEEVAMREEKQAVAKWEKSGLPAQIYHANPAEAKQLLNGHLHHLIAYYGDEVKVGTDGHLEILSQGIYKSVPSVLEGLAFTAMNFKAEKDGTEWTYLPKQGLVPWSMTEWSELKSMAQLSPKQMAHVQAQAQKLIAPKATGKTEYVLQIVSSWKEPTFQNMAWLASGVDETLTQPLHPWIRLITPQGEVLSTGFNWGKTISYQNVAETTEARFRTPDLYEAIQSSSRIVTNIAIDEAQFQMIKQTVERYNQRGIAFNFIRQNCTTFIAHTMRKLGFDVPLYMTLGELFWNCMPNFVKTCVNAVKGPYKFVKKAFHTILFYTAPITYFMWKTVTKVVNIIAEFFATISKNILIFILGGDKGIGAAEVQQGYIEPTTNEPLEVPYDGSVRMIDTLKDFFIDGHNQIYVPRKLIDWQMRQSATTVCDGRAYGRFAHQF